MKSTPTGSILTKSILTRSTSHEINSHMINSIFFYLMQINYATYSAINCNHRNTITASQSSAGQIQLLNRTKLFFEPSALTTTPICKLLYVKGNGTLVYAHQGDFLLGC